MKNGEMPPSTDRVMRALGLSSAECFVNVSFLDHERERPNESRFSCGALKKTSFLNLRAPSASGACWAARRADSRAAHDAAGRARSRLYSSQVNRITKTSR